MSAVRLGSVGYLNARPLVYGLERSPRFTLRFDLPSRCSSLLHEGAIDVGLIPSIEYLRGPEGPSQYCIVPGAGVISRGEVASVALYTRGPIDAVRSIALDTSSRTSVALTAILCAKLWGISPSFEPLGPDLETMLRRCDAALLIGDVALLLDERRAGVTKIDLGTAWLELTGLPFVYALWAGRPRVLERADVEALQAARDGGVANLDEVARAFFPDSTSNEAIARRYLRDNIRYYLGEEERAGLDTFYRYAVEAGVVPSGGPVQFY